MEPQLRFVRDVVAPLRVAPERAVKLRRDHDPRSTHGVADKAEAASRLADGVALLVDYQNRLSAQNAVGVLLVLQGIDASGKDGTIKHVMSGLNPQGVDVRSFKEPSAEELDHDFLWRYQCQLPARGRIGIYNRSHYEEVLVVRVHPELLRAEHFTTPPERAGAKAARRAAGGTDIWSRRYRDINDWERHLVDTGIHVVKVLLNLSKREQAKRFLRRIDEPQKNWKFSPSDIRERRYWNRYQTAFDDMLTHTSTPWAPWYVVPADHKWFARLATAAILAHALAEIDPRYPPVPASARREMRAVRRQLRAESGG